MITITVSEKEILSRPNYYELGEFINRRYHQEKELLKSNRDEHFVLQIAEDGRVTAIGDSQNDQCVMCGKISPYSKSEHIDKRVGYVEGAGQGCFQPSICEKHKH
jgi:hypothetical protein